MGIASTIISAGVETTFGDKHVLGDWSCDHGYHYHHSNKYDLRACICSSCVRDYFVRLFDDRVPWTKNDGNFSDNSFIASSIAMASPT